MGDGERLLAGCIVATVVAVAALAMKQPAEAPVAPQPKQTQTPRPPRTGGTWVATPTPYPLVVDVTEPVAVMPYELWPAVQRNARPEDIAQWHVILRCETSGYDNHKEGGHGEVSVAQILPSTLAGIGLTPADVTTYEGAVRAMVRVAEEAHRQRGDRFWPWTTRGGC